MYYLSKSYENMYCIPVTQFISSAYWIFDSVLEFHVVS